MSLKAHQIHTNPTHHWPGISYSNHHLSIIWPQALLKRQQTLHTNTHTNTLPIPSSSHRCSCTHALSPCAVGHELGSENTRQMGGLLILGEVRLAWAWGFSVGLGRMPWEAWGGSDLRLTPAPSSVPPTFLCSTLPDASFSSSISPLTPHKSTAESPNFHPPPPPLQGHRGTKWSPWVCGAIIFFA